MSSHYSSDAAQHAADARDTTPYRSFLPEYFRRFEPTLQRRIMRGAAWSVLGAGIGNALTMLSNIACARFLGATHYGELAIVLATTNLFTALFGSGVGMTATKYVAQYRNSDPKRAGTVVALSWVTSITIGAATALLIVLSAPQLSRGILGAAGLSVPLTLGAVVMFFAALNGSQTGALTGLEAFNVIALGNLLRGMGIVIFVTAGAALGGVTGALVAYAAVGAAIALFYQIAVRRQCVSHAIEISYRFSREDLRVLSRFTLPVLLTTFSFTPAAWWSNVLLANRSGYSEAGIFGAVLHWQMLILFFSSAVSSVGLPMLSNLRADSATYRKCLALNFLLTSAPAIAIAVPVAVCSPFIMRLYGPAFEHGATALALISLAAVLSAVNLPVGPAIWSLDATGPALLLALLRGAALVLASYALAGKGATGIAGAYVIMGVVQTVATVPFINGILRRRFAPIAVANQDALV